MSKETTLIDVKDFQNKNNANIKAVSDSLYKLAFESLTHDNLSALEKSFKALADNFETISNAIDLDINDNEVLYNFGRISAITELVLDLVNFDSLSCTLEQVSKSYPLLVPALETIKKHNTISGVELQKKLELKSSSNLSNFVKRVDKYELIHVKKIGTTNYFSLTRKAEQLLSRNKQVHTNINSEQIPIKQVYVMLDEMTEELGKVRPNRIKVIHAVSSHINTKDKRLLKHKVDMVFQASEKLKLSKIKKIINTEYGREYRSERNTNSRYFMTYECNNRLLKMQNDSDFPN